MSPVRNMSQLETMPSTTTEDVTAPTTEDGDHERFAHVVVPASAVTEAYITGTPVTALCGKTWVPSRDPGRYPVCPTCKEILDAARAMRDGG